jgi:DnaK suppressor protein
MFNNIVYNNTENIPLTIKGLFIIYLKKIMTDQVKNTQLSEEEVEAIKNELLGRKEQILKDMHDISGVGDESAKVKFPDFGDKSDENAQEIGEYTTNIATEKVLESTLRDIESTLKNIEEGKYGICKYCRKPISAKRLKARPVASACIECKTKLQKAN